MRKTVVLMIVTAALVLPIVAVCQFGGYLGKFKISQDVIADKEVDNMAEIMSNRAEEAVEITLEGISETEQNGVILFKIEGYSVFDSSVILIGNKCGAFLRWTPDEDFVTTAEISAKYDVPNEVEIDYYTEYIYHSIVEHKGGSVGDYFRNIYENVPIKSDYVYIHLHNGQVVYIQQAQYVCY